MAFCLYGRFIGEFCCVSVCIHLFTVTVVMFVIEKED